MKKNFWFLVLFFFVSNVISGVVLGLFDPFYLSLGPNR